MRRANTARIASALQPKPLSASTGVIGPALLGPPVHQPGPTLTPGTGIGARPQIPVPNNSALQAYAAQMRQMLTRDFAGNEHTTPIGFHAGGTQDEPGLPGDPGPPEPDPLPGTGGPGYVDPRVGPQPLDPPPQLPPMTGPHPDPYGLDPFREMNPGPEVELNPRAPNYSGINPNSPITGTFPTFGGGPHVPGNGGRVGVGHDTTPWYSRTTEPWYGRVARALIPYGAGQITHMAAEAARRLALRGTVGGPAHVAGGQRQATPVRSMTRTSPDYERAYGQSQLSRDAAQTMLMAANRPNLGALPGTVRTGDAGQTQFSRMNAHDELGNSLYGTRISPEILAMLARNRTVPTGAGRRRLGPGYTNLSPEILRMNIARGG